MMISLATATTTITTITTIIPVIAVITTITPMEVACVLPLKSILAKLASNIPFGKRKITSLLG